MKLIAIVAAMRGTILRNAVLVAAFALCCSAPAVPLNGVYTCANGNPGIAFNYGDLGDFFNDLETQGMSGPVTLNVFDDGGPFTSNASYELGQGYYTAGGLPGLSFVNPLVIRAAVGEEPVIQGAGAQSHFQPWSAGPGLGAMSFNYVGFITLDGLTICHTLNWAIRWWGTQATASYIRITRCRIFDVVDGSALSFTGLPAPSPYGPGPSYVLIENNMIWDFESTPATNASFAIAAAYPGIEWIIRHNTICCTNAVSGTWLLSHTGGVPFQEVVANVLRVDSNAQGVFCWDHDALAAPIALFVDYNVYHFSGTAGFKADSVTFAQWQAQGFDAHGIVADPQLVNLNPGFEDLHLMATSPARDFVPMATVSEDIELDPRPVGPQRDAGADEFLPPDISVEYAAAVVPSVSILNVGNILLAGAHYNFTIRNSGVGSLFLAGTPPVVLIPGANCGAANAVQLQPATPILPAGFSAFILFIQPAALGPMDFTISINSNDSVKTPYLITINATGVPSNQPARATATGGSSLAGPVNGPFNCPLDPGDLLVNPAIELTDPDLDMVTVLSINLLTAAPMGITAPAIPAPGQPLTLTWTGLADPANMPGTYTWRVTFKDAVNGSTVISDVRFTIANLPPVHLAAGTTAGDGSQATPYETSFNRGDSSTTVVGLATVSDANTGQVVALTSVTPAPGNPGTVAFSFTLANGLLNVAPLAMLRAAEAGVHNYSMKLSDGTSNVDVHVRLAVINTPIAITTASPLPAAETGLAYSVTLQSSGTFGSRVFTVSAGNLPAGLTLNATTGEITGTPTQAGIIDFTVQVDDATGATATHPYQITVTDPVVTPPGTTSDGGNGCTSSAGINLLPLLLAMLGLVVLRRRGSAVSALVVCSRVSRLPTAGGR